MKFPSNATYLEQGEETSPAFLGWGQILPISLHNPGHIYIFLQDNYFLHLLLLWELLPPFPAVPFFPTKTHWSMAVPPNTKHVLQNWSATQINNNLQKSKPQRLPRQGERQPRWVWECGLTQTLLIKNNTWLLTPFWNMIKDIYVTAFLSVLEQKFTPEMGTALKPRQSSGCVMCL